MKVKVSKKQIESAYFYKICVGYCDLDYLLRYRDPEYVTSGTYGWNADIFKINLNTVIITGYRPFGNIRNYDLVKKYNEKARKIVFDNSLNFETQKKKVERLLQKFIDEILKEEE